MAEGVRDDVNVCQLCGDLDNLSVCGGCKGAWYCSKTHQREDWKKHKPVCKKLNKNNIVNPGTSQCEKTAKVEEGTMVVTEKKITNNKDSTEETGQTDSALLFSNVSNSSVTDIYEDKAATGVTECNSGGLSSAIYNNEQEDQPHVHLSTKIRRPKTYKSHIANVSPNGHQQRYYLNQTTQVFDLPPSISELSRSRKNSNSSKPDSMSALGSREQYLLILQARFNEVSKYVVKCLTQYGICVVDKFLGDAAWQEIFKEVIEFKASGVMNQGQLVNGPSSSSKNKHIRGDIITWVDGGERQSKNIHYLISCMDTVMLEVAKSLKNCNINERTKAMVACYPGKGRGYVRHVDNPNSDGRCVTCIYYLNKDWDVRTHGGLLRIYPEGSDHVANIEPLCDRLLFFWSDRRNPHEVEKALIERFAITVWYYDADERAEALKRLKDGVST